MLLLKGKDCQSRYNLCCPRETHSKYKKTKRLEVKGQKKIPFKNQDYKDQSGYINITQERLQHKMLIT